MFAKTISYNGMSHEKKYFKHELISSHTMRRSFCTNAYNDNIPTISIMKISGHCFEEDKINENSVVIDIGALYGIFAKPMLEKFNCYIESYEPSKDNFNKLNKINDVKFKAFNKAVSDFTGKANFNVFGYGWDGGSNTLIDSKRSPTESYIVDVISIDNILKNHSKVDLLKLDCEGAEKNILLNGDLDLLYRCDQISVEFHTFRDYFDITKKDVDKIVERLSGIFHCKLIGGHPDGHFIRER